MFETSRIALASPRLSMAIRLYIAACLVIWLSKIGALYGHHVVWSEYSIVYVALVGAVEHDIELVRTGSSYAVAPGGHERPRRPRPSTVVPYGPG